MAVPERLYKYTPAEHMDKFVSGKLLFRNLSYFRKGEDKARTDFLEAVHMDAPDHAPSSRTSGSGWSVDASDSCGP